MLPTAYDDFPLPKMSLEDDLKELLALPPTKPELESALKQCKSNIAAGINDVNSNMLKLEAEAAVNWLKITSDQIWLEETVPADWRKQIIVPIYKKSSKLECTNYREISLMSVASKVVGKAILNKLKHVLDTQLEENQCGFRPKRGYVARMLIQKAREFNRPLYFCFIDLQKAYDSINREALWQSLRKSFSIPDKIIRILQALHHNTTGIVRAEEQTSEEFPINVGVKQGNALAPVFFNHFLDTVTRVAMNKHPDKGVSLEYCDDAPILFNYRHKLNQKIMIQSLAYADDIVLVSNNLDDLNCLVQTANQTFNNFGIQLNLAKTKYMH